MPTHLPYPAGTVRALLETDLLTPATRRALQERLHEAPSPFTFFTPAESDRLRAVCNRLLSLAEADAPVDVARRIDERLAQGLTDGWRYDTMPADGEAYRLGLGGIEESSQHLYGDSFVQLTAGQQDEVLRQVQRGVAPGTAWQQLPAGRFFEELLAEAVELFYSHPVAQEEIGYVGMADGAGWRQIGLNQREAHEPLPETAAPAPERSPSRA